jgi:DNA-binding response OmpR family regulator
MGRKQILVVDDEWDTAELLLFLLVTEGYRVEYARNGQVAFEMIPERHWDLLMTDLMMPVLDGSELIQKIREGSAVSGFPIMVLSSLPEYIVRGKCQSFDTFLQKPFRVEELLGAVRKILVGASTGMLP